MLGDAGSAATREPSFHNSEMPRTSHLPLLPSTRKRPFIPVYPLEHLYDLRQHAETLFYNVLYVYQRYSIVYFF